MRSRKFKHIEDLVKPRLPPCAESGCLEPGEHKAPLSRDKPGEYKWLCSEHIRDFNRKWDYFNGMSQEEIETFQKDAMTGHRPTWRQDGTEQVITASRLRDAFRRFMGEGPAPELPVHPALKPKDKLALADLDLQHPVSQQDVKAQYKKLVKKYHPDRNPDNKQAEERFKQITASYHYLMQNYCPSV